MKHFWQNIFFFGLFFLFCSSITAQEINCRLKVNAVKIQSTDKTIFKNLEESLNDFLNDRKWSDFEFKDIEKIECSMSIIINEMPSENDFKANLIIASKRPIFSSSYNSTLFRSNDKSFHFNYQDMQQVNFLENDIRDNLTAVLAYYVYVILGYDFDSYSLYGGEPFFQKANEIVVAAQSLGEVGWKAFESDKNRHALTSSLLDEKMRPIRELNYKYHRLGLDIMNKNAEETRGKISTYLKLLKQVHEINPASPLLQLFIESKVDEIVNIFEKGSASEKKTIFELLSEVAPTYEMRYKKLQQ